MTATTAQPAEPTRYRVTAPYVTVRTGALAAVTAGALGSRGIGVIGLYQDALLPDDVDQQSLEHLLAKGMVEAVERAE